MEILDAFFGTRVRHGEYPLSDASEIWNNEQGQFSIDKDAEEVVADAGMVTDAAWADVNGDGWQDLLVAREWDTVAVYENNNGQLVASRMRVNFPNGRVGGERSRQAISTEMATWTLLLPTSGSIPNTKRPPINR